MANALSITEKHTAQIELLRRRISLAPEPSDATRRVTYLQGIAKATENNEEALDDRARRGWDTTAVEDLYSAVLLYVRDMGSLLEDLLGIKDIMDRILDKLSVHPSFDALTKANFIHSKTHFDVAADLTNAVEFEQRGHRIAKSSHHILRKSFSKRNKHPCNTCTR